MASVSGKTVLEPSITTGSDAGSFEQAADSAAKPTRKLAMRVRIMGARLRPAHDSGVTRRCRPR